MSWRQQGQDGQQTPSDDQRAAIQEVVEGIHELTTNIAQAFIIDPDAVAARTGYQRSTVDAVLDAFTARDLADIDELLDRFFHGDNPLRTAPIVADGQGRRMLVHDVLALPAVREVIEARLKAAGRQAAYESGIVVAWVEKAAIDLLEGAFPGAKVYRGFNYFVPDPNAAVPAG